MNVAILGGGLSGFCLAYYLEKKYKNIKITIFEKSSQIGGLLKTKMIKNFVYDVGGSHIIFSKDKEILKEMLKIIDYQAVKRVRKTKVFLQGELYDYPLENGLYKANKNLRFEITYSYIKNYFSRKNAPANFYEWMYWKFGEKFTEIYLKPYNEKIWKYNLREMDICWVERIPDISIENILKMCAGIKTEGYLHQKIFYYPIKGGIYTLINKLKEKLKRTKIITNYKIEHIENSKVDGKKYNLIISTIPLKELKNITNLDRNIAKLIDKFKHLSLCTVFLGYKPKKKWRHSWIYFPDKYEFNRLSFISNYSKFNAPKEYQSVITETTYVDKKPNIDKIIEEMKEFLGIKETIVEDYTLIEYAYVFPHIGIKNDIRKLKDYFKEQNIILFGRFGEHEYYNMDQIFLKSKELIDKL